MAMIGGALSLEFVAATLAVATIAIVVVLVESMVETTDETDSSLLPEDVDGEVVTIP